MISKRGSSQRKVVSGKGVDDLYSYYNKEMLQLRDDMKNLQTENNQLKTLNEKLVDRIELLNSFVEKEASA